MKITGLYVIEWYRGWERFKINKNSDGTYSLKGGKVGNIAQMKVIPLNVIEVVWELGKV